MSILQYGCTTWTLAKRLEKKLDSNYTRMLRALLNKTWRQHPTKQQLYGHLSPIMKTIQVRRSRHAGHCWRSRDELISDVLLWTPSHGRAKAGRPAWTYIQQLCEDMGCSPEDQLEAMNNREEWRERVGDIRADGTTRWWFSKIKLKLYYIKICYGNKPKMTEMTFYKVCQKFLDEPWWLLSFIVFGLLSSSLWLYSQCFSWSIFQPFSYLTHEPRHSSLTRNARRVSSKKSHLISLVRLNSELLTYMRTQIKQSLRILKMKASS